MSERRGDGGTLLWWVWLFAATAALFAPRPAIPMERQITFAAHPWSGDEVRVTAEGCGTLLVRWFSYETAEGGGKPWTLIGTYRSTAPDGEGWLPVTRGVPMLAFARVYDPRSLNDEGQPREIGHGGYAYTYDGQVHHATTTEPQQ